MATEDIKTSIAKLEKSIHEDGKVDRAEAQILLSFAKSRAAESEEPEVRFLGRFFKLKRSRTTVRTEVVAGITTFMTMAYILAVNPNRALA